MLNFIQRRFTPDPQWIETIKPGSMPKDDAPTPRTTMGSSPMSRGSHEDRWSPSMFSDLGDEGGFEKLFEAIPEHIRQYRIPFIENQFDWGIEGVPPIFRTKEEQELQEELVVDWSGMGLPRIMPEWEFILDWAHEGLPLEFRDRIELLGREMVINWNDEGVPHQFNVGRKERPKPSEELVINWNKTGIPFKSTRADYFIFNWGKDGVPEIWEKATKNECKIFEELNTSFLPGLYTTREPSNFAETFVINWGPAGLPRLLRKVCAKPATAPKDLPIIDWGTKGIPTALLRAKWQQEDGIGLDWSGPGLPITSHFLEERSLNWNTDGLPPVFKTGSRHTGLPVIDWSAPGLPLPLRTASFPSRDLVFDWSKKGVPKMFQSSMWDDLSMDWSGRGIPKMIRTKPDRFDYVYAKRLEDFFKPPKSKIHLPGLELHLDWNTAGIPSLFQEQPIPQPSEELCLDWSFRRPPSLFRNHKWDDFAMDWSKDGLPRFPDPVTDKWNPLVINWSQEGTPSIFRLAPSQYWEDLSIDWSQSGISPLFNAKDLFDEELRVIDWSVSGIPDTFRHMATTDPELILDWSAKGLPVRFNLWDDLSINWSVDGLPSMFSAKRNPILPQKAELTINWSSKGMPRLFRTTRWDFFNIDWTQDALPEEQVHRYARVEKNEDYYRSIDWSLTKFNVKKMRYSNRGNFVMDWSRQGLPLSFKRHDPKSPYRVQKQPDLVLDWSDAGLPGALAYNRFWDDMSLDWTVPGFPPLFNVNGKVTCRICRLGPRPIEELVLDWGRKGLPVKFGFWDEPVFNWCAKGMPIAGEWLSTAVNWKIEGVWTCKEGTWAFHPSIIPPAQPATFEADPLKLSHHVPRSLSVGQEDLCSSGTDVRLMSTVRVDEKKTGVFNPWSSLSDNRRDAVALARARNAKNITRAMHYLRHVQKDRSELRKLKAKLKYRSVKRERQRNDKRLRRGDSMYEGIPFVDTVPNFFADWPADVVAQIHQTEIDEGLTLRDLRAARRKTKRAEKQAARHFFDDWPLDAVTRLHDQDEIAMKNKYLCFTFYFRGVMDYELDFLY